MVCTGAQLSGEASQRHKRSGILTSVKQQAGLACHPQPTVACSNSYLEARPLSREPSREAEEKMEKP